MKHARSIVAGALLVLASGAARAAEETWHEDKNAAGHVIRNLPLPALGSSPVRLQDLALGSCPLWVNPTALPYRCATIGNTATGADLQAPLAPADGTIVFPTAGTVRVGVVPWGSLSGVPTFQAPLTTDATLVLTGGAAIKRAPITGDGSIPDGSNTLTISSSVKGLIFTDAADTTLDYLSNKLTVTAPLSSSIMTTGSAPPMTGLKVWLKADAGVTTSGSNVTAWADQSGSGYNFTQAGAEQPVLLSSAAGILGRPAIRFSNATANHQACYLQGTINPSTWSGMTVMYVARTVASGAIPAYASVFGWHSGGTWWALNDGSDHSTGQGIGWAGVGGGTQLGNFNPGNNQVVIQAYQYDKTTWTLSGAVSNIVTDGSFPTGSLTALVGTNDYTSTQNNGDIAEILVWDHKLSSADLAAANAYISAKYGGTFVSSDQMVVAVNYDNASITLNGSNQLQTAAFTGDVTKSAGGTVTTLVNIPNDVVQAGDLLATGIAAPATPATGKGRIYFDSTSLNLAVKNASGTVNHGVQTVSCAASNWVRASTDSGGLTCTQPAESDVTNLTTDLAAKVPTTRTVSTTAPLTGGGALSSSLTLGIQGAVVTGSTSSTPLTLGSLGPGVLQQTTSSGVASVTAFTGGAGDIVYMDGTGTAMQTNGNFVFSASSGAMAIGTNSTFGSILAVQTSTTPSIGTLSLVNKEGLTTSVNSIVLWAGNPSATNATIDYTDPTHTGDIGGGALALSNNGGNIALRTHGGVTHLLVSFVNAGVPGHIQIPDLEGGSDAIVYATAGTGQLTRLTIGSGLTLSGGSLSVTGGGAVTGVTAAAPLFSSGGTTPNLTIQGALTTGGTSTTATSLGALGNGVLQNVVTTGVSAPTVFSATSGRLAFGSGTNGGLTDSANLTYVSGAVNINSASGGTAISLGLNGDQFIDKVTGGTFQIGTHINTEFDIYTNFVNRLNFSGAGLAMWTNLSGVSWSSSASRITPAGPTMSEWSLTPSSTTAAAALPAVHQWDAIIVTLAGSTHVTSSLDLVKLVPPVITDASAVTVDYAATLEITGAPSGAGSATVSQPYSLRVSGGLTRFDAGVQITDVTAGAYLGTNGIGRVVNMPLPITAAASPLTDIAGTVQLQTSGVTAGTYITPTIVVDAYGRVTLASFTNTYQAIEVNGSTQTAEPTINFVGPFSGSTTTGTNVLTFTGVSSLSVTSPVVNSGTSTAPNLGLQSGHITTGAGTYNVGTSSITVDTFGLITSATSSASPAPFDAMHFYATSFNGITTTSWLVPGQTFPDQQAASAPPETRLAFVPSKVRLMVHNLGSPSSSSCNVQFAVAQSGNPVVASEVSVTSGTASNTYQDSGIQAVSGSSTDSWGVLLSSAPSNMTGCNYNVVVTAYFYVN